MNAKQFAIGTITGGVAFFLLGFLAYAVLLDDFFEANAGSASGVMKTEMEWWPLILGNLSHAALLTYVFQKWAGIRSFSAGIQGGALIGCMVAAGFDLTMYDTSNIMNLTGALADIVVWTCISAIAGGLIGMVSK
jgi:uncharacterized membrane protein